ncbi:cobalamin binding intrinsic factor-like isoform X2 [Engraulis encrasicolus]
MVPIQLLVMNKINNQAPQNYNASAVMAGSLLGAMTRLKDSYSDFTFVGQENPDFGVFIESVNNVAGNFSDRTFWQILSNKSGTPAPTPVGVSCYFPEANEHIIFNFTTF